MSIRIIESGFSTVLIKDAAVYHKRRTSFKQFYKQVYNSGIARINLYLRYPFSLKLVHALPSLFVIGLAALAILSLVYSPWFLFPIIALALIIFFDSLYKTSSLKISLLSVLTAFTQLIGYGLGFLVAVWKRLLLRKDEFSAFTNTFYDWYGLGKNAIEIDKCLCGFNFCVVFLGWNIKKDWMFFILVCEYITWDIGIWFRIMKNYFLMYGSL